ncbi:hypothetical protein [Dietzia maris]|uniref:hypothetical protein n=1 Tax=Dietzia maris TaxID=37915 RepID=UPI002330C3F6|nr:hypothetical protein [Dietzia maris]
MKQFTLNHEGTNLLVEFDNSPFFWYRTRLIVNDEVVDERSLFSGTTRLRATRPQPLTVDATMGFAGPKKVVLRDGAQTIPFVKDS